MKSNFADLCSYWTENKWGKQEINPLLCCFLLKPLTQSTQRRESIIGQLLLVWNYWRHHRWYFFPLSLRLFVNQPQPSPPPPTPQTHQIELLKLSGPQSSEHKCQLDYQPNWHDVSPAFLSREAGGELRCSSEVRTVIHTGPTSTPSRERWRGGRMSLSLLGIMFSTHGCTLLACTRMHKQWGTKHTQETKVTFGLIARLTSRNKNNPLNTWRGLFAYFPERNSQSKC